LRGEDIPTVHLSLPERVYGELKDLASGMGIQITDLIKMFIKQGLHGDLRASEGLVNERIKNYDEEITYLKGKVYVLESLLNDLLTKSDEIERRLNELESPEIMLRSKRYGSGRINKP